MLPTETLFLAFLFLFLKQWCACTGVTNLYVRLSRDIFLNCMTGHKAPELPAVCHLLASYLFVFSQMLRYNCVFLRGI